MKKLVISGLLISGFLMSCGLSGVTLTDEMVENYIAAYKEMRGMGMEMDVQNEELTSVVQEHGFTDMVEFMKVTMTVAAGMSVVNTESFQDALAYTASDDAYAEMLNDPDMGEEARKQLDAARAQQEEYMAEQQKFAQPILDMTSKVVDEQSLEVIRKYKDELIMVLAWADQSGVDISYYNYDHVQNMYNQ